MASLILKENPEIDGIMAADMPASAFLKAAVKIGKKVPEEFAVIAYDGTYVSRTNIMEITTIHQQLHEIGNRAVDTILAVDGEMPRKDTSRSRWNSKREARHDIIGVPKSFSTKQ